MADVCEYCGSKIRPGDRFCQECGASLEKKPEPERETVGISEPHEKSEVRIERRSESKSQIMETAIPTFTVPEKRKRKPALAAIAFFLVLVLVGNLVLVSYGTAYRSAGTVTQSSQHDGGDVSVSYSDGTKEAEEEEQSVFRDYPVPALSEEEISELEAINSARADGDVLPEERKEPHPIYPWFESEGSPVIIGEGNSKAFSVSPVEGVTISAEENALDRDREFVMTAVSESEEKKVSNRLSEVYGEIEDLRAFELDAGLQENEMFPGCFQVKMDLDKLDIAQEDYDNLIVCRIGDDGSISEFVTHREGAALSFNSRQNSVIVLLVIGGVIVGAAAARIDYKSGKRIDINYLEREVSNRNGDVVYKVKYLPSDAEKVKLNKIAGIEKSIAEREKFLKEEYGGDGSDYLAWGRKYDDEYKRLLKERDDAGEYKADYLNKIAELARIANDYYMDRIYYVDGKQVLDMPTYVVDIIITPTISENAVTAKETAKEKYYISLNLDKFSDESKNSYDNVLVTLTHELYHVHQRLYKTQKLQNLRWDEATAQFLENDAIRYFKDKGIIAKDFEDIEKNWAAYEYYAVAFDKLKGETQGFSYDYTTGADTARTGYPISGFLEYLWETVRGGIDFGALASVYLKKGANPPFTELLKDSFDLDEETLEHSFADFAFDGKNRLAFYKAVERKQGTEEPWLYPNCTASGKDNGKRAELIGDSYSIRFRELTAEVPREYKGKVSMLVTKDEDFHDKLNAMTIAPLTEKKWAETKEGFFIKPFSPGISGMNKNGEKVRYDQINMQEVCGKSREEGAKSGYRVWAMLSPEMDSLKKAGEEGDSDQASLILPEKSDAAKAGYIDGYVIQFTRSDGTEFRRFYPISKSGKEVRIALDLLRPAGADPEDEITGYTRIAEFLYDKEGFRCFGPAGEKVPFDLSGLQKEKEEPEVTVTEEPKEEEKNDGKWVLKETTCDESYSEMGGWNNRESRTDITVAPGSYRREYNVLEDLYSASGYLMYPAGYSRTFTGQNSAPAESYKGGDTVTMDFSLNGYADGGGYNVNMEICVIYDSGGYTFLTDSEGEDGFATTAEITSVSGTISAELREGRFNGDKMTIRVGYSGQHIYYNYEWVE
ncbi:MAG TPA: hypothetical protein DCL38_03370 [Lachnospiraceae bacterium]|nr:hypothetical protein [Lachnospiraceae bacterium]